MKKLLYSILAIGMSLTGCTDWDDAVSEDYGAGPEISVNVTATTDNSITFTLTPASGTVYYSYVVDKATEATELDGYSLLKQQYAGVDGGLLNVTENATSTIEMEASPNTSYVVYAVAASKEGIVGNVASQVVKTPDTGIPYPTADQAVEGEAAIQIAFSEAITKGEGAVTAQYFAEWANTFTDVPAEDISVSVEGNVVTVATANVPASATVLVSWEEGAFVDAVNNKCQAFTSGLNDAGDDFSGIFFEVDDAPFDITEDNVTSPEIGGSFGDWEQTKFTFTFDMDVYRNTNMLEGNEIKVSYTHDGKVTTIDVPTNYWMVQGKNLIFMLPEEPDFGDLVSVTIAEGTIFDVYGNPNTETVLENAWLRSYGYTRDMVIGSYVLTYMSVLDGETYTENITIEADPDDESCVLMSGFLAEGSQPIHATFNGDYATVTIKEQSIYPLYGNKYDTTIAGYASSGPVDVALNVDADGNLSASGYSITYWAYTPGTSELLGYLEVTYNPTFTKQAVAARSFSWGKNTKQFNPLGTSFVK